MRTSRGPTMKAMASVVTRSAAMMRSPSSASSVTTTNLPAAMSASASACAGRQYSSGSDRADNLGFDRQHLSVRAWRGSLHKAGQARNEVKLTCGSRGFLIRGYTLSRSLANTASNDNKSCAAPGMLLKPGAGAGRLCASHATGLAGDSTAALSVLLCCRLRCGCCTDAVGATAHGHLCLLSEYAGF